MRYLTGNKKTMEFEEWLCWKQYQIAHATRYIVLYRAENTLIRRIVLHNGEIIETYIQDKQ